MIIPRISQCIFCFIFLGICFAQDESPRILADNILRWTAEAEFKDARGKVLSYRIQSGVMGLKQGYYVKRIYSNKTRQDMVDASMIGYKDDKAFSVSLVHKLAQVHKDFSAFSSIDFLPVPFLTMPIATRFLPNAGGHLPPLVFLGVYDVADVAVSTDDYRVVKSEDKYHLKVKGSEEKGSYFSYSSFNKEAALVPEMFGLYSGNDNSVVWQVKVIKWKYLAAGDKIFHVPEIIEQLDTMSSRIPALKDGFASATWNITNIEIQPYSDDAFDVISISDYSKAVWDPESGKFITAK